MSTVIGVRFKKIGKLYYFDPADKQISAGAHVIVETSRGVECGEVVLGNAEVAEEKIVQPLRPVMRIATRADLQIAAENKTRAQEAFVICKQKIENHGLDMHLVEAECTFDVNKILFYFTADGRVDFRELVKDLASVFHTRIELRQIGVRDEAKMIGGLGACGRELCCASYMDEFQPVSINMAKEQNLSLNPAKISGTCGRLMCCLKYEHEVYADLQKKTPRQGSYVETPEGMGTVVSVQMLRGLCRVQLEDSTEEPKVFACADCRGARSAKGRTKPPVYAEPEKKVQQAEAEPRKDTGKTVEKMFAQAMKQKEDAAGRQKAAEHRPMRQKRTEEERPVRQKRPVRQNPSSKDGKDAEGAPRKRTHRGGRRNTSRTNPGAAAPKDGG